MEGFGFLVCLGLCAPNSQCGWRECFFRHQIIRRKFGRSRMSQPRRLKACASQGWPVNRLDHPTYFILQLLYDVMDIPFGGAEFWDSE